MLLNEKLKELRKHSKLSQEKVAERVGVSRQAVTKWESGQTVPNAENLICLASIYGTSVDELVSAKSREEKKENKILQANLTLLAIILQAAALNVLIQPMSPEVCGLPASFLLLFKVVPLMAWSIWMAVNLRYEKNKIQYRKNTKIELLYCVVQLVVAMFAYYSGWIFLGTFLIMAVALIYILIINPKYMNRVLTKKK